MSFPTIFTDWYLSLIISQFCADIAGTKIVHKVESVVLVGPFVPTPRTHRMSSELTEDMIDYRALIAAAKGCPSGAGKEDHLVLVISLVCD